MFTVFNRDALIEEFKGKLNGETTGVQKFKAERNTDSDVNFLSVEQWDAEMSNYAGVGDQTGASIGNVSDLTSKYSTNIR